MKTKLNHYLALLFLSIFILSACSSEERSTTNHDEQICLPTAILLGDNVSTTMEYDENDRLVKIVDFNEKENKQAWLELAYNQAGNIKNLEYYDIEGLKLFSIDIGYTHDKKMKTSTFFINNHVITQKSQLISPIHLKGLNRLFTRIINSDLANMIIQMEKPTDEMINVGHLAYEYTNNKITKSVFYSELDMQNIMVFYNTYKYDQHGNLIENKAFDISDIGAETGQLSSMFEYEYDKKSNPLRAINSEFTDFMGESFHNNVVKITENTFAQGELKNSYTTTFDYEYNKYDYPEKFVESSGNYYAVYDNRYKLLH